jgi:hypothetical protein
VASFAVYCQLSKKNERMYCDSTEALDDAVERFWEDCANSGDRWRAMVLLEKGGQVALQLVYDEEYDLMGERFRDAIVKRYMPGVRIIYPLPPER